MWICTNLYTHAHTHVITSNDYILHIVIPNPRSRVHPLRQSKLLHVRCNVIKTICALNGEKHFNMLCCPTFQIDVDYKEKYNFLIYFYKKNDDK